MKWDKAALKKLERIPKSNRKRVRHRVEAILEGEGKRRVTLKDFQKTLKEHVGVSDTT